MGHDTAFYIGLAMIILAWFLGMVIGYAIGWGRGAHSMLDHLAAAMDARAQGSHRERADG